jgi:hypothetical protein
VQHALVAIVFDVMQDLQTAHSCLGLPVDDEIPESDAAS